VPVSSDDVIQAASGASTISRRPIVVMLGCLIPVGEALKETGAAGLRADGLTLVVGYLSGNPAGGFILLACMPSTPCRRS